MYVYVHKKRASAKQWWQGPSNIQEGKGAKTYDALPILQLHHPTQPTRSWFVCVWVLGAHDTCVDPYMSEGMNELKRRIFMVTDSRSIYQLPFFSCEMLQFHLAANFKIHWNVCPQLLLSSLSLAFQRGQLLDVGLQLV